MGWGINEVVRDWLGEPKAGPGRIGGSSGWSGTDRGTFGEALDVPEDIQRGPVRVGGTSGRSWPGRETLGEVLDRSGDPRGGPGRVEGTSARS